VICHLSKSYLDEYRWFGIRIGSVIMYYCNKCKCQRTFQCIDKKWVDGDWVFCFICETCFFPER